MKSLPIHSPIVLALTYHYDSLLDYVRRNFTHARTDHQFAHEVIHEVCIALIDSPPPKNIHTPLAFLRLAIKNRAIDCCRNEQTRQRYVDYVDKIPDHHQHDQYGANALDFSSLCRAGYGYISNSCWLNWHVYHIL